MKRHLRLLPLALLLQAAVLAEEKPAGAADEKGSDFVRFQEDEKGAQLQTSIATYRNAQGVIVELIGAIHVADKTYYEQLNEHFKRCDALLYEMVGGPIQKREARAESLSAEDAAEKAAAGRLSWLQTLFTTLQSSMALESQMTVIDYHAKNFFHADMTLSQFAAMQEERNEGFLALWLKAVKVQMDTPEITANQPGVLKILEILCSKDSPTELKRLVGRTFDSVETLMAGLETGDGTVIVTERNKLALEIMQKQIALGRKHLGIFYGAAHLPDMETRLLQLGFKLEKTEWLTAWDLPPPPPPPTEAK
jgi:hypothetical protein